MNKPKGPIRVPTAAATLVCCILCGLAGCDQQGEESNWSEQFAGVQAGDDRAVKIEQACAAVHAASRIDGTAPTIYCDTRGGPVLKAMLADSKTINGNCWNFAAAFVLIMGELGEVARPVQLGSKAYILGEESGETHVLAEVFDPSTSSWFVVDPTFNATYTDADGHILGAAAAHRELLGGRVVEAIQHQPCQFGRCADQYYMPVAELFYMVAAKDSAKTPEEDSVQLPSFRSMTTSYAERRAAE